MAQLAAGTVNGITIAGGEQIDPTGDGSNMVTNSAVIQITRSDKKYLASGSYWLQSNTGTINSAPLSGNFKPSRREGSPGNIAMKGGGLFSGSVGAAASRAITNRESRITLKGKVNDRGEFTGTATVRVKGATGVKAQMFKLPWSALVVDDGTE